MKFTSRKHILQFRVKLKFMSRVTCVLFARFERQQSFPGTSLLDLRHVSLQFSIFRAINSLNYMDGRRPSRTLGTPGQHREHTF